MSTKTEEEVETDWDSLVEVIELTEAEKAQEAGCEVLLPERHSSCGDPAEYRVTFQCPGYIGVAGKGHSVTVLICEEHMIDGQLRRLNCSAHVLGVFPTSQFRV